MESVHEQELVHPMPERTAEQDLSDAVDVTVICKNYRSKAVAFFFPVFRGLGVQDRSEGRVVGA